MTGSTRVVPLLGPSISNEEFLRLLFGDQWNQVLVTSFMRDPSDPLAPREDWNAWPAGQVIHNPHFDEGNTYFSPSLFRPGTKRHLENFQSFHVIVIDDVGTKIDLAEMVSRLRCKPTYQIETSPRNHQAGWKIEPETDLAWVKGILTQLDRATLGKADNLVNPIAWRRLPMGRNTKAALGPAGWRVKLKEKNPQIVIRGLDWLDIEPHIGPITRMTTLDRGTGDGQRPDAALLAADPIYQALEAGGRIVGDKITSDKFWAATVLCPWIAGHGPTRPTTGAEYVPAIPGQRGWFHCFHCENRNQGEFREQLDVVLREEGAKIVAAFEFDEIDPATIPLVPGPGGRQLASYEATEDGLALAFAAEHEGRLRFDGKRKKWFVWTGGYWRQDDTERAFVWARKLLRQYRKGAQDLTPGQARAWGKIAAARAIEQAARAQLAVDGETSWDQDIWLAGAPGCEIDLRTGAVVPPDPAHGITKQLKVTPDPEMPTPLWDKFLWESTGGDIEMIAFLQAWYGYNLTGDASEEKFVFVYGTGGNGKGTLLHTIEAILNDYAARCDVDMFMVRKYKPHSEEVARLAGVRMVSTTENEEGHTFNAVRLKDFTGRDGKLSGAFKYRDTFEFQAQFKLTFVGNNQPRLPAVDEAMRRRLVLAPFTQTPAVPDITLKDRLAVEYPGILAWLIEGENRRRTMGGLSKLVPASAKIATRAYLADQDTLQRFAEECCRFDPRDQMGVTEGFEAYRNWCYENHEPIQAGSKNFSGKFVAKFPKCKVIFTNAKSVVMGASVAKSGDRGDPPI